MLGFLLHPVQSIYRNPNQYKQLEDGWIGGCLSQIPSLSYITFPFRTP